MSVKTLGINALDDKQRRRHINKLNLYAAKIAECRLLGKFEVADYAKALGKPQVTVIAYTQTHRDELEECVTKYLELFVSGSSKLLNASAVQRLSKILNGSMDSSNQEIFDKVSFARHQESLGNIKRIRWYKDEIAEIELGKTATEIASEIFLKENKADQSQTQGMQIIVNSSVLDAS